MRHLIANLFFWLLPISRMFWFRRFILSMLGHDIGPSTRICGQCKIFGQGKLIVGQDTWISLGTTIFTHPDAIIEIGPRCDIGPYVSFVTGTHKLGTRDRRAGAGLAKSICVGANCWIGAHVVLLAGAQIGNGSVVGAGAVVLEGVYPDNSLIAGNPARLVKTYND